MPDDDDDALVKFAREVIALLELYRWAQETLSQDVLDAFNRQLFLVESLAAVAVMPVTHFVPKEVK